MDPWVIIGQELLEDLGLHPAISVAKQFHRWITGELHLGEFFGRDVAYDSLTTPISVVEAGLRHAHLRPDPAPPHIQNTPAVQLYRNSGRLQKDSIKWKRLKKRYKHHAPEPRIVPDSRTYGFTSNFSVVYGYLEDDNKDIPVGSVMLVATPDNEHQFHKDKWQLMAAAELLKQNRLDFYSKSKNFYFIANLNGQRKPLMRKKRNS